MMNKTKSMVVMALMGIGQAAKTELRNTNWPKFTSPSTGSPYAASDLETADSGYGCIRNGFYYKPG